MTLKAGLEEPLLELGAGAVHHDVVADIDHVAGERGGIVVADGDALFRRDELLDLDDGIGVERARIIDEVTAFQRAETGIEMIKALVGEAQGDDAHVERLGQRGMGAEVGAHPVADPEQAALAVEQGVAFALEWDVAREIGNLEAGALEPVS